MTIGIVGNYGNDNQGDEAILEGIIIQLEQTFQIKRKDIIVFSNNPEQTRNRYRVQATHLVVQKKSAVMKFLATMIHHKKIVQQLDLLIIGGGGILMDLYRNAPIVYSIYNWLAKWTNTPTAVYAVGAGPIETSIGKFLIKSIANNAKVVTVRDMASKQRLQSIGIKKNIDIVSDPAFFLKAKHEKQLDNEQIQIGVTAVAYYDKRYWPTEDKTKYDNYVNGMAQNLDELLKKYPNAIINFFSTKHPEDTNVTKDIATKMEYHNRTNIYDTMLTHENILKLIAEQHIVIGTRLHSVILSIVSKKPVIAISYHHKVRDVLRFIGCEDVVISIDDLHENDHLFTNLFSKVDIDWDEAHKYVQSILKHVTKDELNGMHLLKEHFQIQLK